MNITIACLDMAGTTVSDDGSGGQVTALPGAAETITALRAAGIRVCLATGLAPPARDAVLDALGWWPLIDLALSPADAGRGGPWPDLPLAALIRLGGGAVSELAVAGDTASDIESGLRAGAGLVAGVLTGSASREELEQAGAPHVLDSVGGLLAVLGIGSGRVRGSSQQPREVDEAAEVGEAADLSEAGDVSEAGG
jgi:phosphonatase-like hydrolase